MINIIIHSDPRYNINHELIRSAVLNILQRHHIVGKLEVGISVVGDRKMHELNKKYRNIDNTANILTFALEDPSRIGFVAPPDKILRLGDIIISQPQALEDASLDGVSVDEELRALVEHGTNHLLGIHHSEGIS